MKSSMPTPGLESLVASLTASGLSKLPYQQRLDALHTLHNCDTLPSKDIHIKAFTSSKPIKSKAPCHNFARGSCKFGDTCKYAHGDLKSPKKNPSRTPLLATAIVPSHMHQPSQEPPKQWCTPALALVIDKLLDLAYLAETRTTL